MATFVYSDPHFDAEKIIIYGQRPFKNVDEMNKKLIDNYNKTITKNDICYWLGDVMYGATKDKIRNLLSRLHGRKYLIMGNHDRSHKAEWWQSAGFDRAFDHPIYIAELFIMLSHEPLPEFGNTHPIINYHGHIHIQDYNFPNHQYCINACVEKNNYHPIALTNPYISQIRTFQK